MLLDANSPDLTSGSSTDGDSSHKRKSPFNDGEESSKMYKGDAKMDPDTVKALSQKLKGGVIMEVRNAEEAKMAEDAGVRAVLVIYDNPGGIGRMPTSDIIEDIKKVVKIPVMAKVRIGHFIEAQIVQSLKVDCIVECELLSPAHTKNYVRKDFFSVPLMCGVNNLKERFGPEPLYTEALDRMVRGAAFIKISGGSLEETAENVMEIKMILKFIRSMSWENMEASLMFAAGDILTPADAAWMMVLGCDGVVLGTHLFDATNPFKHIENMVQAVDCYTEPDILAKLMKTVY